MLAYLYIVGDATVLDMILDGLAWPKILHNGLRHDPNILGKFIILSSQSVVIGPIGLSKTQERGLLLV